ncbi:MAG: zinc ribbon domain-containing protein [Gammaproteobacteria bacterium]|nr:zinc ribbon domain-containing protein [Gammaproteobacteria bacterium]
MPVYEYECTGCGEFSAIKPMSHATQPCACPHCGTASARKISAPFIAGMSAPLRQAWARNEKSAHEPATARKSACGSSGAHTCRTKVSDTAAPRVQQSTRRNQRPWMLGH